MSAVAAHNVIAIEGPPALPLGGPAAPIYVWCWGTFLVCFVCVFCGVFGVSGFCVMLVCVVGRGRYVAVRFRRRVCRRSAMVCEVRWVGCLVFEGLEFHHRRMFSDGGRHSSRNLVHVCDVCHKRIHGGSGSAGSLEAHALGLLLSRHPWRAWRRLDQR